MTVVIRDGKQIEVPHRPIPEARAIIAKCQREHGLLETYPEPGRIKFWHGRAGPTFTTAADRYKTVDGIWAMEEWLRSVHGEDDLLGEQPTEVR